MDKMVVPIACFERQIYSSPEEGTAIQFIQELGSPCIASFFSFIRIFNACPEAPVINVYVNDVLIAKNLRYKDFSHYIPIPKGLHNIKIYLSNNQDNPILKLNGVDIIGGEPITFCLVGALNSLKLISIIDDIKQKIYPDRTVVRIVNLTLDPLTIHILLKPNALYRDLSPGYSTEYITTGAGNYGFKFYLANKEAIPLSITASLRSGRIYTLYAVGSLDPESQIYKSGSLLEIIKSVDGNTIFKPCPLD